MTSNAPPLYDTRERIAVIGARIAFVLGLASAAFALLAGPSYRTGVLALGNAVLAMRWAAYGALAAAAIALLALGFGIAVRASSGRNDSGHRFVIVSNGYSYASMFNSLIQSTTKHSRLNHIPFSHNYDTFLKYAKSGRSKYEYSVIMLFMIHYDFINYFYTCRKFV